MGQQVWTFNDITGTNYTIGLYHGEDSGHVIIYQNTPYNLQLKKNKKEEQQMIIIGQIVLIIFLIALFTYNYYFRYRK